MVWGGQGEENVAVRVRKGSKGHSRGLMKRFQDENRSAIKLLHIEDFLDLITEVERFFEYMQILEIKKVKLVLYHSKEKLLHYCNGQNLTLFKITICVPHLPTLQGISEVSSKVHIFSNLIKILFVPKLSSFQ